MSKVVVAAAVALSLLTLSPTPTGASSSCGGGKEDAWFLAVVYDDPATERDDFKRDFVNFQAFLDALDDAYCIPASQSEILAFDGAWSYGGTNYSGYTPATEANVKDYLDDFGAAANADDDATFFFFLSSHGIMDAEVLTPCAQARAGSYSALGPGGVEDGKFYDCELGLALTSEFSSAIPMFVAVDCSFCGGFSDSLTAVSGTVPDDGVAVFGANFLSSYVPRPNRIVVTGCAITTECFGGGIHGGAVLYDFMYEALTRGDAYCDGWTVPGFPTFQGVDAPVKDDPLFKPQDGICTASEWFFSAIILAVEFSNVESSALGIQEQQRIKYRMPSLADDILILA